MRGFQQVFTASGARAETAPRRQKGHGLGPVRGGPESLAAEQPRARTQLHAQHPSAAAASTVESPNVRKLSDTLGISQPTVRRRTTSRDGLEAQLEATSSTLGLHVRERAGVPALADVDESLPAPSSEESTAAAVRRVQRSSTPQHTLPLRGQRLRVRLQRRQPVESVLPSSSEARFQSSSSGRPARTDRRNDSATSIGQYTVDTQSDLLTREEETLLVTRAQAGIALEHTAEELGKQLGHSPTVEELACHIGLPAATVQERLALGNQAKHLMVKHNLRLVISVARRYAYRGLELSDLIQEGAVGLIRGIQRFDPSKGYKFSTYSHWWIRQSVSRAVIDQGRTVRLPAHIVEMLTRMRRAEQTVKQQGQPDEGTAAKVGELLGVTPERVRELLVMSRDVSSMDAETSSHSSKGNRRTTLSDSVAALPVAVEEEYDSQFLADDLNAVLNTLEPRERNVLRMHFGLVGTGRAMTLVDVGATYGLSRERVRQIEDIAFRKLRNPQRSKTLLKHMENTQRGN